MLATFATVLEYSHYRHTDTTANPTGIELRNKPRIKSEVEGIFPTLQPFPEFEHMKVLRFLATIKNSLRALYESEGVAVRISGYVLIEDTKE